MLQRNGWIFGLVLAMAFGLTACKSDSGAKKEAESEPAESSQEESSEKESGEEGDEHPGDEHPGDEHPGDEHHGDEHHGDEHHGDEHEGEEHPGDEHPGDKAEGSKKTYDAKDIKKAMKSHIDSKTAEGKEGVFEIEDPKAGETLELKFVKIHDPVRKIEGKGYFACTDFHVAGAKKKVYDLDFWLNPKDGELKVTKTKIHKHPVKKDGEWKKKARYTFKDDEVVKVD